MACGSDIVCEKCGQNFETRHQWKKHVSFHHNDRTFACKLCDKTWKNKNLLSVHIGRDHCEPAQCEHCPKMFRNKENLRKHILRMHTENDKKPHICDICGKGFASSQHLINHRRIHTKDKLFYCRVCSYSCVVQVNRDKHERNVHKFFQDDQVKVGTEK